MSNVTKRTVTTTRHEYVVISPAVGADVVTAMNMALADMPEERRGYDDACMVEVRGNEIVVWWPEDG